MTCSHTWQRRPDLDTCLPRSTGGRLGWSCSSCSALGSCTFTGPRVVRVMSREKLRNLGRQDEELVKRAKERDQRAERAGLVFGRGGR